MPSCQTSGEGVNLSQGEAGASYPEQDGDGTGHADLTHAHHRHLVPGRLRRAAEQRVEQLMQDGGHFQRWGGNRHRRAENCPVTSAIGLQSRSIGQV